MLEAETEKGNPSCWKKRTCLEICLMVLTVILSFFILYSAAVTFVWETRGEINEDIGELCVTPECVKVAAQILNNIDPDVDPCDDFYKFTCGNFAKFGVQFADDDDDEVSTFTQTRALVTRQVKSMYEEPILEDEPRPFQMMKSFYNACMDTISVNSQGVPSVKRIISRFGGWPVLEGVRWNEENFDWTETLYKFLKIGLDPEALFSFSVQEDPTNSSKNVLHLNQPSMTPLRIETLRKGLNDSVVQAYYDYMIEIAATFGAQKSRAAREMREVIDFEIELSKVMETYEEQNRSPYKNSPLTIQELKMIYRYVDWIVYINNMLYPIERRKNNDVIIVATPRYFKDLETLLDNTPKRTLANYVYWKMVDSISHFVDEDLRKLQLNLYSTVRNVTVSMPRWKHCRYLTDRMTVASNALYARKFFNNDSWSTMKDIIDGVKSEFVTLLEEAEWMDEDTKEKALSKTEEIEFTVNFPEEFLDDEKLEEHYEDFYINPNKYAEAILNISLFRLQTEFATLDEPVLSDNWYLVGSPLDLTDVNFLITSGDELGLAIPISVLQGPVFNNDIPQYMNFGAIGFLLGEKITFGFHTNNYGELLDWWEAKTRKDFQEKTQCILDRYEEIISESEFDVNTLITDLGAVKVAYRAYEKWTEANEGEDGLPGLLITPQQMFWISLGNLLCAKTGDTDDQLEDTSISAYDYYKLNLLVMNSEKFAEDFECPTDSKMNPKRKCTVW